MTNRISPPLARTSDTHPLRIAELEVSPARSTVRIGLGFCPGKHQDDALTGAWARDLATDLTAIRDWGAAAVVTLVERHELHALNVAPLGEAVVQLGMHWVHLPIPDMDVPDATFEQAWREQGSYLRRLLRSGFSVYIHCKGGLGRAGMIAARLLVELGWAAQPAIAAVRAVRPGAIETASQEAHVHACARVAAPPADRSEAAVRDRAVGVLLGLAAGDALGTTLEFSTRDRVPPLTDIVGGGPFKLLPGQWTDDTAMALALAESLLACGRLDERDLMQRFVAWWRYGEYSCTGTCFDIGVTTRLALARFVDSGDPIAGDTSPATAGNGSLMRLAPIAIRYWNDAGARADAAARQSRITHAAPEAVEACVLFADMLAAAIAGEPADTLFEQHSSSAAPRIAHVAGGSWRGRLRASIRSTGYVVDSLEAAIWAAARAPSLADALLLAANLGDDADTVAAITGQLAGALHGADALPVAWTSRLCWGGHIRQLGQQLFDSSLRSPAEQE